MCARSSFIASLLAVAIACAPFVTVAAHAATAPVAPTYELGWGGDGTGPGQFRGAYGVVVDAHGDVYVADSQNQRIQKFDPFGNLLLQWGSGGSGNGQFSYPDFLALDRQGNVYVSDYFNNRVQKFTSAGVYLAQWGTGGAGPGQFNGAEGLAIDQAGNVYVGDYNNNRVQKFTSAGVYVSQWGTSGAGNGQFNGPEGIAIDRAGNVYVDEFNNPRIQKFTSAGVYVSQWGTLGTGNGQMNEPGQLAFDAVGNLYVADYGNNRVQKFDGSGNYLAQFGAVGTAPGQLTGPWGVSVDAAGNAYVSEWFGPDRVQKFSGAGASLVAPASPHPDQPVWHTGTYGTGPGQLGLGYGVAIGAQGQVYAADTPNNRIELFNSIGGYMSLFGTPGSGTGQLSQPYDVATDAAGNVYVADTNNNRIQKFTSTGAYITQWGTAGSANGQFSNPRAIAIDATGNVYVVDFSNFRVQKFTSTGTFVTKWGSNGLGAGQFGFPADIAVDGSGNVYVVDANNNNVQKFNSAGTYLGQWGSSGSANGQFSSPQGITVDAQGYVYVADGGNGRIQVFTGAGTYVTQFATSGPFGSYTAAGMAIDATGNLYAMDVTNAFMWKFAPPQPRIVAVSDVGNDQGSRVQLRISGSAEDAAGTGMTITSYAVYRRNDPTPGPAWVGSPAPGADPAAIDVTGWTFVGSFPAHGESEYSVIVPTAANYTSATSIYDNAYFVRALTADPLTYIDSAVEYGYSIDNLTPPPPTGFAAQYAVGATNLQWDPSAAPDVSAYRVYRGPSAEFAPGPQTLVASTPGTTYSDVAPRGGWYKLSAVDRNGNESPCAMLSPDQVTIGVPPLAFALDGVRPNPVTSRELAVRFTLPVTAPARIELLDVTGRIAAAREVGSLGIGAHTIDLAAGARVGPGLYFVRLRQGANEQVTRVTVLSGR
ncbi:MAG TPA: 6-bladed beta-propeller [Gemmatimonadales bacterium]|nr:6-bladed beta-propeller [Gemmatimonadales bacterium]